MLDIRDLLATLARQRPIFHSEADFQHAFAWEMHQRLPNASIRLELPFRVENKSLHLDIWEAQNDSGLAIELKYKTRRISFDIGNEQFNLADHSAQDIGRYDFIKDIQRIEQIIVSRANTVGYAILLTNDSAYWKLSGNRQTVDASFRLHEGRDLGGELGWGTGASDGTKRNREDLLKLRGKYKATWQDYSHLSVLSYGLFRCLIIEVH